MYLAMVYWSYSLAGWQKMVYSNMLANFWKTFLMLASWVTNLKHAGSLTTSTSSAGWESENFENLLAGGEERVFFPQES